MSATRSNLKSGACRAAMLCALLALNACGGGGGSDAPAGATQPQTPTTNPTTPTDPTGNGGSGTIQRPVINTTERDAARLLEQATFGPTPAELSKVMSLGIVGYVDDQLTKPRTGYMGFKRIAYNAADDCRAQANDPTSAASLCARDNYTLFEVQRQFFANAMTGEDQLRQRMAFALSQIFVVSGTEVKHAYAMASYQNLLLNEAFGNFRDLLEHVTLNSAMGMYLDMVNNDKVDAQSGAKPNENYAREFLQLFTIGTVQLNLDGTIRADAQGEPLPTYSQNDVEAFARVFTGWTYPVWSGQTSRWVNPPMMYGPMVAIESHHDAGEKTLLGVTLPAGQAAQADLDQALDAAFNHPNVGPFIATRLIQHFVTSNPSPAYVARVAAVFNDNGSGVRGDLAAVICAILFDSEARGETHTEPTYGKLKDPALFMTGLLRALGGKSDGVFLRAQSAAMGQDIFAAPSVFNYYSPLQRITDGSLFGPEFGIFDGVSALARIDFVYQMVYANGAAADETVTNSSGTTLSFVDATHVYASAQVANELDARLMFGKLSDASYKTVNDALASFAPDDVEGRARAAAYVLGVSAQYQVQR